MSICFVLGNGRSRLEIQPEKLKSKGKVYACNAIYRDFIPNYLIAVDAKMVIELTENSIQTKTEVWTNYNKRYKDFQGLHYFNPNKGWSSGPTALWLASVNAINSEVKEVYILGFDYTGIDNKLFNNVYADTKNYKRSTEPATFFGNWMSQTENVIKDFPQLTYIRVLGPGNIDFDWKKYKNYKTVSYTEFKNLINYEN